MHLTLFEHVRALEEIQKDVSRLTLYNAKLYTGRRMSALAWGTHTEEVGGLKPDSQRRENLIANGVDTATALIGKQRPKATPTPKDADFTIERLTRNADKWLYAEFKHQDLYNEMQRAFNDCCWAPIGALFIGIDGDEIFTERVMPDEIVVDQRECQGGNKPLQIHRRRLMQKVVLKAMYPEFAKKIDDAGQTSRYTSYRTPASEMVVVIESWKLALPGESVGKHALIIDGATLVYEDYKRDRFPFIFLRWTVLPTGFYGKSLVEEGAPFQIRHNELNTTIRKSQDLMCVPRLFIKKGSNFEKEKHNNEIGEQYYYSETPPQAMAWGAVPPELYAQRRENKDAFFESIGLSRMSAQAKLPDGVRLDSSKALREASFKQTERFQRQSQMLEDAYLLVADHYLELGVLLYSDRKTPKEISERSLVDEVSWSELGRPGLKYSLQLEASSIANMQPSAREDQLDQWANNGLITQDEYKGMLGHPDLPEEISQFSAGVDDIKATAEELDKGETPQPDPLQNLTWGIPYIHKTYLRRRRQVNIDDSVLQGYRDWLAEARAMLEATQAIPAQSPEELAAVAQQSNTALSSQVGPEGIPLPALAPTG